MSVDSNTERTRDHSASYDIVEEVAAVRGVESHELDPLYTAIDPDALDDLFAGPSRQGRVAFRYEGCTVAVDSDGRTSISETADDLESIGERTPQS